jgi:cation diffusion facilitator family transporter
MENTFVKTRSEPSQAGKRVTLVGVFVNAFLIVFKFSAGVLGHSQALIADGVHSISDLFTDMVVLLGLKMGRKAADEKHQFGHGRMETLASAVVGVALIATALYLGIEACWNIYRHTEHHPTRLALFAAAASIILKEVLYGYTVRVGRRIKSPAIIANAWHHRSDALSSVAVLLGVAGALIRPSWHILDSYAALVVSFLIIKVGLETIVKSLREFIDTAPPPEILERITQCARSVNGVIDIHDLRARTTGGVYQMEAHVVVDGHLTVFDGHRIAKKVESCLMEEIESLSRVIVHVDPEVRDIN